MKALGDIAAAFEKSDGVSVLDYRVEGEDEAPMSLLRTHRLFPLDYLSLRDLPGGELPTLSSLIRSGVCHLESSALPAIGA